MGEKKIEENVTYKINAVEVFSAGTWNGDKYTVADLHEIVQSFNSLRQGFTPFIKLGHDNSQKLARSSGLPSVGWVENLYVQGSKLLADLDHIPEKVFKLIKSKAYRKVSCEIYFDLDVNGTKYSKVLAGIALLGAETPGVLNLEDILGNYALKKNNDPVVFEAFDKNDSVKGYSLDFETKLEESEMPEISEDLKKVQDELDAQKKEFTQIQDAKKDLEKQLSGRDEELKKFRVEAENALAEAKAAKVAKFISELESKKLSTPSMKDLLTELLSDKKEYSVKDKKYSKEEILNEILTLSKEAAKVNFDENSRADFDQKASKQKQLDEKIEKYQTENKCTYSQAVKAVMRETQTQDTEE